MKKNKILDFFITTLSGMANGLFATLIIGTIFATIGKFFTIWPDNGFCKFMIDAIGTSEHKSGISYILQLLTGAGIGAGVALSLKFDTLKTIALSAVGELAAYFSMSMGGEHNLPMVANSLKVGDPLTIYIVCISVALLIKLVLSKKTSVDILLIPLFVGATGLALSLLVRYPASYVTFTIQWLIAKGTTTMPLLMGIIVAVLMGMALTAPISSAAIGAIIFTGNLPGLALASGAAVVGCSTQMVGFAIQSRKDNNVGEIISVGIGTSMLQFGNILRKPIIWLPTIIASAILGPISTLWLKLECFGASAGMGTAGLVGQIGTFSSMGNTWQTWVGIIGLEIILPIILVYFLDLLMRKFNLIKAGDFSLKRDSK